MLKRHCKDTVTLYNYLGETDRKAQYSAVVLHNAYVEAVHGVAIRTTGTTAACKARIALYDEIVQANKPFLAFPQWQALPADRKPLYWTLSPLGKDKAFVGESDALTPPEGSYKVTATDRYDHGQPSLWHWEVTGA